jgi:hypothetical protein
MNTSLKVDLHRHLIDRFSSLDGADQQRGVAGTDPAPVKDYVRERNFRSTP